METEKKKKTSGCHGLEGEREEIGRAQKIFKTVKPFCMIL